MTVFSGIRPSGPIHIGNYLGAIKSWIALQEKHPCFFCIVDLHAITTPFSPSGLKKDVIDLAAFYLSLGLDPEKSTLFIQSQVKEHVELAWILGTITPLGELSRMTQYKDKSKQLKPNQINAGLLYYPVLMAADILLYQAEGVPVGEDQKQHVELARVLARKFNHHFGETFKIPRALITRNQGRIRSLRDPSKKMSKTDDSQGAISFLDSPKEIRARVMNAVTDSEKSIKYDPEKRPGLANLLNIYSVLKGKTIKEVEAEFSGLGYKELKESLAESLICFIEPIQRDYQEWISRPKAIMSILDDGRKKAQDRAQRTIKMVKDKIGFID